MAGVWQEGIRELSGGKAWAQLEDGGEDSLKGEGVAVLGGLDDNIVIVRAVDLPVAGCCNYSQL